MKVRLLNDGNYYGLEKVKFPVEIEGKVNSDGWLEIDGDALNNLPKANPNSFLPGNYPFMPNEWEQL